ncbi:unnamed protein product [Agarophyton chilense]
MARRWRFYTGDVALVHAVVRERDERAVELLLNALEHAGGAPHWARTKLRMMKCAFGQAVVLLHNKGKNGWSWAGCLTRRAGSARRTGGMQIYTAGWRQTVQANSLEDSKRRAKSQYDNIPDLNQQYLAELSWVERKYGAQRVRKDASKEAQRSILQSDKVAISKASGRRRAVETVETVETAETAETKSGGLEAGLRQYEALRRKLIGDTLLVGTLGLCAIWTVGGIKEVQSFAVGMAGSVAYVTLLARSVDRLGESAREGGSSVGDSLQPARVAILALLVIASAKNSHVVSVLPVLVGFFSYKVALLIPLLTGEAFDV